MNISLSPQLEKLVQDRVESGRYTSASEVVREALRLFEEFERVRGSQLQALREQVMLGVEQLDRGQSKTFDENTVARIKAQGRKRRSALKDA